MSNIRELILAREESLSPYAFKTKDTKGRLKECEPSDIRTEFQRDRDRIIHCQSFRRLMHKTQVFLCPTGDHYRTRLIHTLEVTQIARILARALNLNEDLTEAAALGHDLGHTPFGHSGEDAMQKLFSPEFTHYRQSLRVVDILERDGEGLNLTYEVRDGIVNHTGKNMASTLEGVLVKFADRIAYINADIDDAIRAKILRADDLPEETREVLGRSYSERINTMVNSIVKASEGQPQIAMEPHVQAATDNLRKFMFENIYVDSEAKKEDDRAKELLGALYHYYEKHPEQMPELYRRNIDEWGIGQCVCDYIAGMSDRFAIDTYKELFIPKVWAGTTTGM